MILTLNPGYPDRIGKRFAWVGSGLGPTSYNSTTKDPLVLPGFQNYIDAAFTGVTVSGTYRVVPKPSAIGPRPTWVLVWYTQAGVEVTNAVNLSAEKVIIGGFGGTY